MAGVLDPTGAICRPYDEGVGTRVCVDPWLLQPGEKKKNKATTFFAICSVRLSHWFQKTNTSKEREGHTRERKREGHTRERKWEGHTHKKESGRDVLQKARKPPTAQLNTLFAPLHKVIDGIIDSLLRY